MCRTLRASLWLCAVLAVQFAGAWAATPGDGRDLPWRAGVAVRRLTPPGPIWLAGYAARNAPSAGVELDVHAKALAFDDGHGGRAVIVTMDLIRVPHALRVFVETEVGKRFGLRPHEILLNASHTHSGPEVEPERLILEPVFRRSAKPTDIAAVNAYQKFLRETIVELVGESLATPFPARVDFFHARAGFAMNRRRLEGNGTISNNPNPAGPVDHDVPVLRVSGADGRPRAIVFGYACHNTTLSGSMLSSDYAGYAQRDIEEAYPGVIALFVAGCGGDQNPYPRHGSVPGKKPADIAAAHGSTLANAVHAALGTRARAVAGPLHAAYGQALLTYEAQQPADLAAFTPEKFPPEVVERADVLKHMIERKENPPPFSCPVQVLRFGHDLTLVALGGEAVVDYSLRLKRELAGEAAVWVAGYSNDVFGYLGSSRVIREGGYEGGSANTRILNHPGRFTPAAEEAVIAKAHELVRQAK
ncbi:MAG: neutral/alkaline non-lysosomal ceramidase N-terminal domain-containing protein [Opitutaceae bacterium]|nr:neutral/alkaline non-lysosomal ceramidase N-terminal domain-containing protein [Opitutaceae bacterium]